MIHRFFGQFVILYFYCFTIYCKFFVRICIVGLSPYDTDTARNESQTSEIDYNEAGASLLLSKSPLWWLGGCQRAVR